MIKALIAVSLALWFVTVNAGSSEQWLKNHYHILYQEFVCKPTDPGNDMSPCNYLVSNVLSRGWGLSDFGKEGSHKSANQMLEILQKYPPGKKSEMPTTRHH